MPAIYHEGSWLGNATDPEVLVKDTVGWTGKNLLKNTAKSQTINGVTFTVNADGSVTANGTASSGDSIGGFNLGRLPIGKYILTGCPFNGGSSKYDMRLGTTSDPSSSWGTYVGLDSGEGLSFEVSDSSLYYALALRIYSGYAANNLTFYPMIRRADIIDDTYEPYHESVENVVEQVYADNGVLGAKNLLPNNAKSQTVNGVTFTVNADGSVVLNGTATNTGTFILVPNSTDAEFSKHNCILTGCPVGGSNSTYNLCCAIRTLSDSGVAWFNDFGSGVKTRPITSSEMARVYITYYSGQTYTNLTFKPMLRLASDPDDTYQPHAMTNRELTEKKINIADLKTVVSASSDFADFKTRIASL